MPVKVSSSLRPTRNGRGRRPGQSLGSAKGARLRRHELVLAHGDLAIGVQVEEVERVALGGRQRGPRARGGVDLELVRVHSDPLGRLLHFDGDGDLRDPGQGRDPRSRAAPAAPDARRRTLPAKVKAVKSGVSSMS